MSNFRKLLGGTAVALTLIASAGQASAALIQQWDYVVTAGWGAFAPAAPNQGAAPNDSTNNGVVASGADFGSGPTVLSWGQGVNGGPSSSLVVEGLVTSPPNPTLVTNGGPVNGAILTHNNNVITGTSNDLSSATLQTSLTLTALPGGVPVVGPIPLMFGVNFFESPNNGGTCVGGSTSVCDDVFVLTNPEDLSFDLVIEDFIYTISLFVEGLATLGDDACAAAGVDSGCEGFLTQENLSNSVQTTFQITATPVAEPGTLALLGLGLLGLGIARRRKAAA